MKTSINKYAGKISNLNKEINRIEKEMLVVRRSDEYEDSEDYQTYRHEILRRITCGNLRAAHKIGTGIALE